MHWIGDVRNAAVSQLILRVGLQLGLSLGPPPALYCRGLMAGPSDASSAASTSSFKVSSAREGGKAGARRGSEEKRRREALRAQGPISSLRVDRRRSLRVCTHKTRDKRDQLYLGWRDDATCATWARRAKTKMEMWVSLAPELLSYLTNRPL